MVKGIGSVHVKRLWITVRQTAARYREIGELSSIFFVDTAKSRVQLATASTYKPMIYSLMDQYIAVSLRL